MCELSIAGLLDKARAAHGWRSDYALAKGSGLSLQLVANWRHGRSTPDEKSCLILGAISGVDPYRLAVWCQEQRACTDQAAQVWAEVGRRLEVFAAVADSAAPVATKPIAPRPGYTRRGRPQQGAAA